MSDKALAISYDTFFKRFRLLSKWLNNERADALLIVNGNDNMAYSKTMSIHQWLFGYSLPNSAFIIYGKKMHIFASKKVCNFLKPAMSSEKEVEISVLEKSKTEDDKENAIKFVKYIENITSIKSLGHLPKDNFEGKFFEIMKLVLKDIKFDFLDVSASISNLFAVKDEDELEKIKKASETTAKIFNKELKETILNSVDEGKIKHSDLSAKTDKFVEKFAKGDMESLDLCYPPIIQSGGKFNLKFSVESDENNLHAGVIVCSMGLRYEYYCSNVIRTLMINANAEQKELYEYIVDKLYVYALEQIQPGKQFGEVSKAIEKKFSIDKPDLTKSLITSFGFSTGVEFKDRFLVLAGNSQSVFKKNMVIIFYIGLQNLENKTPTDKRSKLYAIWIGDTIVVGGAETRGENPELEVGGNLILTCLAKRRNKQNLFQLKDEPTEDIASKPLMEFDNYGRGQRRNATAQVTQVDETNEAKRKVHQHELFQKMLEDCEKRLLGVKTSDDNTKRKKNYISYKSRIALPKDDAIYNSHVFIDKRNHTVLLYPNGAISPFHMSIIKNASFTEEGDKSYLRFNFNAQGFNTLGKTIIDENTEDIYLKELTIKTSNMKLSNSAVNKGLALSNVFQTFKEEQKRYKTSELQAQENADLVVQDTIVINPRKEVPKLKDLFIRPTMSKQRISGNLECHQNGLRFSTMKGENIDIMFNNIKHAFYQPCDKEMIVLIHFHLKNPIVYSKKKQIDIQFYTEVGEMTTDLGKFNHMHDRDDLESEQKEKEMRKKINEAFLRFCNKVEEISNERVDFDQPFRKLGFMGCPNRSTVLLQPSTSCLVQLTEWPPFVVTMDEVELIFFERVNLSNKSFDMIIVFKDYNEKPVTITSLPQDKLDDIKSWLDHIDIFFSEGGKSLNWVKIMKNITDDPKKFLEEGGWAPLCGESDEESENEDMEEDEVYEPSDDGDEDGSDESADSEDAADSEFDEGDEEEESDSGEQGLDSDESKGMDWDELEEEARKADMETEPEDPPRKKRKH
uniref:FACT complex subunit n=1 Tax=Schmidtea mediterranea TaxID=79327 RepID=M9NN13_SCHMD|nr:SPT16 [Schmidtea mediterranea]